MCYDYSIDDGSVAMNMNFELNDYVLAWNLLYKSSLTEKIKETKKHIWKNYKNQYNNIYKDMELILEDPKNFIPSNDTVYNIVKESEDFEEVKKQAEKYRISLMKLWDKNRKKIEYLVENVFRKKIRKYDCSVINKEFNIQETYLLDEKKGRILIGKDFKDENDFLVDTLYEIAKKEIKIKESDDLGIKDAIIELAVSNEFATLIKKRSCYKEGTAKLFYLKKQIYPYWLMYLGIKKEDMVKYMMRDKIAFEVKKFAYEKELINMNLEEFIEFIIRNSRYIIREKRKTEII